MEGNQDVIVVPFDFTEKSDIAVMHAVQIGKVVNNEVLLIYFHDAGGIFASKSKLQEKEAEINAKFEEKVKEINEKYSFSDVSFSFRNGKPKSILKCLMDEKNITLFVMGPDYKSETVEINPVEYVNLVKEIITPVIFTKQPPINEYYRELVVPVEYDKKYKEELKWIILLAKHYKCNVNLIRENPENKYIKKHIENNVYFTKKMLDANKIIYGLKMANAEIGFKESIFDFAHSIDADLIIVMSHKFKDYACDKNNCLEMSERTPVMVINPRADLTNYQGFY